MSHDMVEGSRPAMRKSWHLVAILLSSIAIAVSLWALVWFIAWDNPTEVCGLEDGNYACRNSVLGVFGWEHTDIYLIRGLYYVSIGLAAVSLSLSWLVANVGIKRGEKDWLVALELLLPVVAFATVMYFFTLPWYTYYP